MTDKSNYINCPVCGEANSADAVYCSSCGAKISDKVPAKNELTKDNKGPKTQTRKQKGKILAQSKIAAILLTLIVCGFSILHFSGALNGLPEVNKAAAGSKTNLMTNPGGNPHGSTDMDLVNRIKAMEETYSKNPDDYELLIELAHLLNDSGMNSDAIEKYKVYLEKFPDAANVWVDMGVCYYELKDSKNALSAMKKALAIVPKHQIAHFNLGIVNLSIGKNVMARDWWQKAVEIDPNSNIGKKAKELLTQH